MAAIQQIQNLIALSQPIPPDLQVAALLEAQQQGLSSNALAGVFGVPESMIADSVSALGLSGQLSPNLGGTLAPATKFDNNIGVVSGRTAAAQESQPIELAPPALLPEGYGSTIDRPFSGVLSLPDINTLRGNVFDEDLEYQDAKERLQDIQEGLFSGATDSPGAILKAIIDSTIASQNQAGTSANNFSAGTWYDPDTGLEIPNFDPTTGEGMGTLFPTFVPDSDAGGGSEAAAQAAAQTAAEKALSNISAEGGFSEEEANEVYDLLEANTVTLNDVSTILNVPEAVVTAGYNQIKAERAAPEEIVDLTEDTTASTIESGELDFKGEAKDPLADYRLNPELYTYDYVSAQLFEMIANETNAELRDGLIEEYEGLSGQAYDPNKPIQPIKKSNSQIQEEADAAEIENAARTEAAEKEAAWGNVDKDLPLDQIVQAVINIFGTGNEGVAKVIDIANQRGSTTGDIATASGISIEDVNAAAETAGVTINTTPADATTDTTTNSNNTGNNGGGSGDSTGEGDGLGDGLGNGDGSGDGSGDGGGNGGGDGGGVGGGDGNGGGTGTAIIGDIVGGIVGGLTGIGDGNGTGDGSGDGSGDGDGNGMNNGLFVSIVNQTPLTESILFQPKFTELDNVQLGMFERFLRAAGGR